MTDNRTTELLPCPFCGGEAVLMTPRDVFGGYAGYVECPDCKARTATYFIGQHGDGTFLPIEAWNRRKGNE